MKGRIDISIIIVSYNTKALMHSCLSSIEKTLWEALTKEIIVVDNGSTDGTVEKVKKNFPDVTVIENKKNIGFAAGNNQGIKASRGRYILLLNSDTEVYPETLKKMVEFVDAHKKAGASTCKLVLPDGSMDPACHRGFPTPWAAYTYFTGLEKLFPRTRIFGQYHMGYLDITKPHRVDCISGAFFLTKRDVIESIGMLDERFFMYGEDIDWAYRMRHNGWEVWFNPEVRIIHYKKQSGRESGAKESKGVAEMHFLNTMKIFYQKHYEKKYNWLTTRFVYLSIFVKIGLLRVFGL
jgi:GT2 family glycosyltransferase